MNSQPTTRQRLIEAGATLFAESGYRGAAVRDLCNLARVNPGAVSYHFGGKRQLYRAVLRQAAEHLATVARQAAGQQGRPGLRSGFTALEREIRTNPRPARLLLRDLADGGQMAVEALAPILRELRSAFAEAHGVPDEPAAQGRLKALLLGVAGPLFLTAAAWPLLEQTLGVDDQDRVDLFERAWD